MVILAKSWDIGSMVLKQVKMDPLFLGSTNGKVTEDINGLFDTNLNTKSSIIFTSFNGFKLVKMSVILVFPWLVSNFHFRTVVELLQVTSKLLFAHKVMDGHDGSRYSANTGERYSL